MDRRREAVHRPDDPRLFPGLAPTLPIRPGRDDDAADLTATRYSRDPVQVQSEFRQHLRHGTLDHCPAARFVSGDLDGARDWAGKGTRLDYQFVRNTGHAHRI